MNKLYVDTAHNHIRKMSISRCKENLHNYCQEVINNLDYMTCMGLKIVTQHTVHMSPFPVRASFVPHIDTCPGPIL